MSKKNIEELIIEYVENNITEELKDEFINAAIHFIINEDTCSQYDIMRIKYRLKRIKSNEIVNYINLCATYGYIIYRALLLDLVKEEEKSRCCAAVIEISNEITKYVIMENDENDLYLNIQVQIKTLGIGSLCNAKVLEIFKEKAICF